MTPERMSLNPHEVRGLDLFPEMSDEIDRRDSHLEQRIKFWVMAGVAANLLVAILAAIPVIFYMGQVSRDVSQMQNQITMLTANIKEHEVRIQENTIWRARMEERNQDEGRIR
jgi:Tfp pilus assembly protein PilN